MLLAVVLAGCGTTTTVTDTVAGPTKTVTAPARAATHVRTVTRVRTVTVPARTVTASTSTSRNTTGLTLSGNGSENLGPITVPVNSELVWSCPSCVAPAGFGVVSGLDASNDQAISTTTTGQTSGQTFVDPGTYPDVQVFTEGSWTMTITPSG